MSHVLDLRGLKVRHGATIAVQSLDLILEPGQAVALLGPNGAGKTSTLRALSHQVKSSYQHLRLFGEPIERTSVAALAKCGLIHVPEGRRVFAKLSVHENLEIGKRLAGSRRGWTTDEVYSLFPTLARMRGRQAGVLSGGEQQMVAIGRALTAAPRLLMLDEPSLGLAPRVANDVYQALDAIRSRTSLLIVEQNAALALRVCASAVVMARGRVVLRGSADELSDQSALAASYLGVAVLGTSAGRADQVE